MIDLPISEATLKQFQQETAKDATLQILINYAINGWPSVADILPEVKCFYSQHHEIVFNHDLLLKGQRIIIPASLRSEVKHLIHQGHLGVDKCKLRARHSVYWPEISHEITQFVLNCPTSITHRNRQQQETLLKDDVLEAPWIKVAADLFTIYGKNYLLIVDYSSKYFEISHVREPVDSPAVVNSMKKIFSRRTVQTIKNTLKKAHEANEDVYLALLALNSTPSQDGTSPPTSYLTVKYAQLFHLLMSK